MKIIREPAVLQKLQKKNRTPYHYSGRILMKIQMQSVCSFGETSSSHLLWSHSIKNAQVISRANPSNAMIITNAEDADRR